MKYKLTAAIFTLLALPSAHAVDNNTLKSLAVGAGILTNTFAIYNRDQLDCRTNLQLGYQYGQDEELSAHPESIAHGLQDAVRSVSATRFGLSGAADPVELPLERGLGSLCETGILLGLDSHWALWATGGLGNCGLQRWHWPYAG